MVENFTVKAEDGKTRARFGVLKTAHGKLETPFFMPVATKGSVKLVSNEEMEAMGVSCFISNAFVLYLRPGLEVVEAKGGLHEFIGWDKGIFTDSGGFQLLSDSFLLKVMDRGVRFRSPFDGSEHLFTPEQSVSAQNVLGSDVAMVLDDVPRFGASRKRVGQAVARTRAWAERCVKVHSNEKQLLFGITQGGLFKDLREKSIKGITELGFDGFALGGLCIGESSTGMQRIVEHSMALLPKDRPRYLMGVGSPGELLDAVAMGVDVFDSAFPTRTARHGLAFTGSGGIQIDKARYKKDFKALDEGCGCFVCKGLPPSPCKDKGRERLEVSVLPQPLFRDKTA